MSGEQTSLRERNFLPAAAARWSTAAILAGAGLLAGCFADSTSTSSTGGGGPYGNSSSGSSSGSGPAAPLLVDVDTGGTLVTTAGNGIGVYVEYQAGGLWRVSWTCDTLLTNLSCRYVVDVSVSTGAIANTTSDGIGPSDSVAQANPQQLEAVTTTTTGVASMVFDTTPGAAITVSVALDAPVSFFFVQDNLVNGGYTGALTNPLIFQPSTP